MNVSAEVLNKIIDNFCKVYEVGYMQDLDKEAREYMVVHGLNHAHIAKTARFYLDGKETWLS